jgi:hypothetical protein
MTSKHVFKMVNTVTIDKTTLQSIVTCLQVTQAKATLLQTHTCLLHNAFELKNLRQHFEPILVQNPIFEDDEDDDVDLDQQLVHEQLSETYPDSSKDKFQLPLSMQIIRHWEELRKNKHKNDILFISNTGSILVMS